MGTFAAGAAEALYASRSGRGFAGVALFVVFVGCFCFFFLFGPPLSPAFLVFRLGVPWALASCGPPACPPFVCLFFAPPCLWCSVVSGPGCLGPWRLVVLPPAAPLFAFCFAPPCLWGLVVSGPGCFGPWRSVALRPGTPLCFFSRFLLPPPLFICLRRSCFSFVSSLICFFFLFPLLPFFFCLRVPVVRCLGWFVCPGPWAVLVCVAVGVVPRQGLVCACAVSLVAPWL